MSALAMSYASTADASVKAGLRHEIVAAVNGLKAVQDSYAGTPRAGYISPFRDTALDAVEGIGASDDPVIVPYYNLHKVLAGLLEIGKYVEGPLGVQAMEIAEGFGEYFYGRVSRLSNTATLLRTEYGGMNDALYELYSRTGNPHFKIAAEAFDEVSLFRDLAAGKDILSGRHANTTIPKLIGALKRYTVLTQNQDYYDALTEAEKVELPMYLNAAQNFWRIVVDHHTYAIGANSQGEHFHGPDTLYQYATQMGAVGNPQTAETCNEYNMLKLTREMFKITQDVRYADYYENTFINSVVSSQDPDSGMTTYFQPMAPGYNKLYSMPFTDFWCCTGTGMESFSKLADSIYFTQRNSVYVNMFFSSRIDHRATNTRIVQQANLPNENTVTFTVTAADPTAPTDTIELRLRKPDWLAGEAVLKRNGEVINPATNRGYFTIKDLNAGDSISYTMPMQIQIIEAPDNPDFVAFKYGPVVLSTGLGTANLDSYQPVGIGVRVPVPDREAQSIITTDTASAVEWKSNIGANMVRLSDSDDGQVRFGLENTLDGRHLVFSPHFQRHQERYGLYMFIEVRDSDSAQARILESKIKTRDAELNIDSLYNFDANNFEAEKNLKSANSQVGVFSERRYRDANAGGWFSYELMIDPLANANYLAVDYYSGDIGRSFDVYINDEKFKTETVNANAGPATFYTQIDQIPAKYLTLDGDTRYKTDTNGVFVLDENGDKIPVITVRFQSTGGYVGGVFGLATQRPAAWDTNPNLVGLTFSDGTLAPSFAPEIKEFVLTVPMAATQVSLSAVPHKPSGLVYVDGVLIDDTLPRTLALAEGVDTTVELKTYAQDHLTSTQYVVKIVRGVEPTTPGPTTTPPTPTPTTPNPTAPSGESPSITVSKTTVQPGERVTITGARFGPGENVRIELHSTPLLLDMVTSNADGGFDAPVIIPESTSPGGHNLVVTTASGVELRVEITVGASTVGGLPITGAELGGALGLSLLLVAAGFIVVRRSRRATKEAR